MTCKLCGVEIERGGFEDHCQPCYEGAVGCERCGQKAVHLVGGTKRCIDCHGKPIERPDAEQTVGEVFEVQDAIRDSAKVFRR